MLRCKVRSVGWPARIKWISRWVSGDGDGDRAGGRVDSMGLEGEETWRGEGKMGVVLMVGLVMAVMAVGW